MIDPQKPPHFTTDEFAGRLNRTRAMMKAAKLDALLLFAPQSHYWLTGYDTFGYCFFQCMIVPVEGEITLLTRSADLRQAQHTSIVEDIRIWADGQGVDPTKDLKRILKERKLHKTRLGVEMDTQGLTGHRWKQIESRFPKAAFVNATGLIPQLRLYKSAQEIEYVQIAARLADDAFDAALQAVRPGVWDSDVLAALQGSILQAGGDYAGNEFICGSGEGALLCRYFSGRRVLQPEDQLTLEWAGTWRRYHAAMMNTVIIGRPRPEHLSMRDAAKDALLACEAALTTGRTMGDVFAEHARVLDEHGLRQHRLNACGYSLGAGFTPCWMDPQMFYDGAETEISPNMVFFLHMILMDSDSGAAQTLGRTSLTTADGPKVLSRAPLELQIIS